MAVKVSDQEAPPASGSVVRPARSPAPAPGRARRLQRARLRASDDKGDRGARGVVEALLFRNFGSKAALFNEVVFGPCGPSSCSSPPSTWTKRATPTRCRAGSSSSALRPVARERGLIITYIATIAFEPGVLDEGGTAEAFRDVLNVMDNVADSRAGFKPRTGTPSAQQRKEAEALRILERSLVGMVMSAALFGDMLFSEGRRTPKRNEIVDELTRTAAVSLRHARETLSGPSKRSAPAR